MAKMFYNAREAAARLNMSDDELKELVRAGKLREFRDGTEFTYKIQDIDKLDAAGVKGRRKPTAAPPPPAEESSDIILEPVDEEEPEKGESSVELAPAGSDVLSLEEVDAEGTAAGVSVTEKAKEGSVVSSVGVSVFDDDELDEIVDPLAQTQVSDAGALGIEGVGSGSGILDLTRERDDTSLGAELLDEIYTGDEESAGPGAAEDTRAGLAAAKAEEEEGEEAFEAAPAAETGPVARAAVRRVVVEYGPDAVSTALTALMVVGVVVLLVGGLGAAALVQGVLPGLLGAIYDSLAWYGGGAVLLAIIAAAVSFFVARRTG
ncbi:MAG TPA: helix-turn-helix domain-containing protein [Phycisphaerae bacterium]|nr:helix-turn-helix domain-containing protein [Phycisphaerae bacterium]HNU45430.1 helix-turn-helix domain-containing protein [Phycisphaerae bacterium]